MKENRSGYPDKAPKIGFVQILTLSVTPEITILLKAQWPVYWVRETRVLHEDDEKYQGRPLFRGK